jgi:ribokinase
MQFEIVVLGSLHMDIVVTAKDRPRKGETVVGSACSLKCGGKGGNQAVEAARHGATTAMVSLVGSDHFGRQLVGNLRSRGVDTTRVLTDEHAGSGMSVAIIDEQGDYGAVIVSGVNLLLGTELPLTAAAFGRSSWLIIQNEVPNAANITAARIARRARARVLYNAAPARLYADGLSGLVDILVVNALEAESLGGRTVDNLEDAAAVARSLLSYAPIVIVTAGSVGLVLATRDEQVYRLRSHAVKVASTHGAGDCFIGALAARLSAGDPFPEALKYSNAAAALLVGGASEGARGPEAVRNFLQDGSSRQS